MVTSRRSRALCRAIVACQLVTSAMAADDSVSISISSDSTPSGISQYVDISFGGFGIEPSNLFSFTGQENQNDLSINLLENLANYTGESWSSASGDQCVHPRVKLNPSQENHLISEWAATPRII